MFIYEHTDTYKHVPFYDIQAGEPQKLLRGGVGSTKFGPIHNMGILQPIKSFCSYELRRTRAAPDRRPSRRNTAPVHTFDCPRIV